MVTEIVARLASLSSGRTYPCRLRQFDKAARLAAGKQTNRSGADIDDHEKVMIIIIGKRCLATAALRRQLQVDTHRPVNLFLHSRHPCETSICYFMAGDGQQINDFMPLPYILSISVYPTLDAPCRRRKVEAERGDGLFAHEQQLSYISLAQRSLK